MSTLLNQSDSMDEKPAGRPLSWAPIALAVLLALLYAPVVWEGARLWFVDDNYAHGVFIFPISIGLLWMQRKQIQAAVRQPAAWGLVPLAIGLLLETGGYLLDSKGLAMLSLVPVLAGAVLVMHGPALWRITCFPICFLAFTARIPGAIFDTISQWVQRASTIGAAGIASFLGYAVLRTGNMIQIPGYTLEVADVCSGFKKLLAMVAFALLYGYIYRIGLGKRALLVAAAIPIAVLANVLRIAGLIAVTSAGGMVWMHRAHDSAEMFVVIVSFFLFVGFGRLIGCETTRFSQ